MAGKKKKEAKLASGEKEKPKYKVTLIVEHYKKESGSLGLRKRWIKEEIPQK